MYNEKEDKTKFAENNMSYSLDENIILIKNDDKTSDIIRKIIGIIFGMDCH